MAELLFMMLIIHKTEKATPWGFAEWGGRRWDSLNNGTELIYEPCRSGLCKLAPITESLLYTTYECPDLAARWCQRWLLGASVANLGPLIIYFNAPQSSACNWCVTSLGSSFLHCHWITLSSKVRCTLQPICWLAVVNKPPLGFWKGVLPTKAVRRLLPSLVASCTSWNSFLQMWKSLWK